MIEVKIIKRFHAWQVGEVVAVSEAIAVKLIRNGYAESVKTDAKTESKTKTKK